jgi:hypothetical protein
MANLNLSANSTPLAITQAKLDIQQIDYISVVSINEMFNISVVIIDSQSRLQIGNIQWRNFTWLASVSLYNLPEFNSNGTLNKTDTSSIIIDISTGTIIATNLIINTIGMYLIKVQLISSNNEYNLSLISNGILVKASSSKMKLFSFILIFKTKKKHFIFKLLLKLKLVIQHRMLHLMEIMMHFKQLVY